MPSATAVALLAALGIVTAASRASAEETAQDRDEAVHAVDAIVVTGSRIEQPLGETPVATQVISREEIASSGARDLGELLEEQPGVYLERTFAGAGAQLGGLPADYTLVLVDGLRVPGRLDGVFDLSRISAGDVERVEIVRGASSALYGSDAMAGVINVITRAARRPLELEANGSFGAYETIDLGAAVGARRQSWAARISGERHSSAGFDLDPSDVATTQGAFEQYSIAALGDVWPARDVKLRGSANYRVNDRQAVDLSDAGGAIFDRQNLTEDASFLFAPEWSFGAGRRLSARASFALFRDQFLLDQRGSSDLDELQDTRENLTQVGSQLDLALGSSHLASVGLEGSFESLGTERLSRRGERLRGAVYLQDEWTLVEAPLCILMPGARLDVDSQFGAHVTPRAAIRFDPVPALALRLSYGFGFKAPDFRELYLLFENPSAGYLVEGNPDLDPETSRGLSLSAEYQPERRVWLSAQGFQNDLQDRIGTDLAPAEMLGPRRFRYENVASALARGIELSLRVSPLSGLRIDASYALTETRDDDGNRALSGQPSQRATLGLRYRVPAMGFETSSRAAFVGRRPFYQDTDGDGIEEQRDAAAYASIDLRVAQDLGLGLSSFLLAENLLDAGDAELTPIRPRSLSGGVRVEY